MASPSHFDPTDVVQARRAVTDPATSGADLQAIAAALPSLWTEVAAHPNAYPALLAWLAQTGDPAVAAAIGARSQVPIAGTSLSAATPVPTPPPPSSTAGRPRSSRGLVALAIALAVLLVGVAAALVMLVRHPGPAPVSPTSTVSSTGRGGTNRPTTATAGSTSSPSPAGVTAPATGNVLDTDPVVDATVPPLLVPLLQQLPTARITVNPGNATLDKSNIQAYADDVADGNVDQIVAQCWTQPPEEVRLVYSSPRLRGAILEALQQPADAAQYGVTWLWSTVRVTTLWDEFNSAYPCPTITWDETGGTPGLGSFTPAMARSHLVRALAIHDGAPLHKGDGTDYAVLCSDDCASRWDAHGAGATATGQLPPIRTATTAQWDGLRTLSTARIIVEHLSSGYYRVRAIDGSTSTVAYFVDGINDFCMPYELGEIV